MKKLLVAALVGLFVMTGCSSAPTVDTPSGDVAETTDGSKPAEDTKPAEEGTRDAPYPIGSVITDGDWTLVVNSVTLDATEALTSENMFNDAPAEGSQYLMANVTVTYNGDNADGEMPVPGIAYVTSEGNTINSYDKMIIPPEQFDSLGVLYAGASTTGNYAFEVPTATAGEGVLAVTAHMLGDKVFVAVQ
ncbi:DUF4352 domain-containing protein [Leucobacter sp. G161]|uniref:DUF4352 domain-containing protein n=1 Tax=Leucobacter sp. G161 TaxID=663704 RepID=UPI00073B7A09|nr:DUF4352 domain-containing protein [Leucobacter sp. G161]KUF07286.1 hypothetical protein AUL38_09810 [Leucobacter sp. G161]